MTPKVIQKAQYLSERNKEVAVFLKDGSWVTGTITFVGFNQFLKTHQVTLGRFPIRAENILSVWSFDRSLPITEQKFFHLT